MTEDALLIHRDGPVCELVLNRPSALNALNRDLIDRLGRALREASRDDSLRCLILTGNGRAFSAGVDLKEIAQASDIASSLTSSGADGLLDIARACRVPIISGVNGFAITGGLELALMGDFLIASEDARFADTHARVGITPSWGMTQILPRLIGVNRARQMSLTGGFVDAGTALSWGLVNEVLPPAGLMPRARALAAQVAETDRSTMERIRDLINTGTEHGLSDSLAREVEVFQRHIAGISSSDVAEGRTRVTERGRQINR